MTDERQEQIEQANDRYLAAHFGRGAAKRIEWITTGDYRSSVICDLFPYWQEQAVSYAVSAAKAARGLY